ncbi:extradiol dioxygenase [Knoellia sinensis KCTC 19936]|uniref:Extradiol dioxygenase n=1 Tax=Knoellia sinensis KCTC 19936 TaxID=1385520 RepID=A0A0A0J9I9_9MICO|nr:VOC family protein [Knoellia sinensis]KGN34075.1 extradiol dioxygenase [Knoellia sinensis KCTC 19936]
MISALHTLIYSDDAPATRAFFRDVLQWPFVSDEVPEGEPEWLIFQSGPSELGVHPTTGEGGFHAPKHHSISLLCDDLAATMDDLRSRGAEFTTEPVDRGFGIVVFMAVPGADDVMLYEPRHTVAHNLDS